MSKGAKVFFKEERLFYLLDLEWVLSSGSIGFFLQDARVRDSSKYRSTAYSPTAV